MDKSKEVIILAFTFLVIPISLLAIYLTDGAILPVIETKPPQTWNIQYLPLIVIGIIGAYIAYLGFRR